MKIEINFDPTLFKREYMLNFDMLWKIKNQFNFIVIFWGIISIVLGWAVLSGGSEMGYLIIALSFIIIIVALALVIKNRRLKSRYLLGIHKELSRFANSNDKIILFEFSDDYFRYKDYRMDVKYAFKEMQGFRLVKDCILIDVSRERYITFALDKKQLDITTQNELIDLLKRVFR